MEAVVLERTFNAPVARVWRALTTVEELRSWYFCDAIAYDGFELKDFKPEVGFEFEFIADHEGNSYHHLYRVTEVIPQKKLAYTWRYKGELGDSLVTWELTTEGDKTRVKVTHTGIETFSTTPAYARKNFESGWMQLVDSKLKRFVEKNRKHNHDYENSR
jgi:uncharacterized protein YndB with AHSA1/START domain